MDPFERLRSAGRRVTDPAESLAQAVAERVLEVVIQALDLNEIIRRIDLTSVLDQVDINHVLDRVDVDRVLDRVDVNRLVEHTDVDAIVQRVDVDGLISRVDINALIDRVDVDALIGQTDLGSIIAKSTSGFASEALDTLRSQAVMVDQYVDRVVWRLERREGERPRTPSYAPRDRGAPVRAVLPQRPAGADGTDSPREADTQPVTTDTTDPAYQATAQPAAGTANPPYQATTHPAATGTTNPPGPATTHPATANPPGQAGQPAASVPRALAAPGGDPLAHRDVAASLPAVRDGNAPPGGGAAGDRRVPPRGGAARARGTRTTWTSLSGHYAGGASRLVAWIIDAATTTGAFTIALAAVSYAVSIITGHSVSYSRSNWVVATIYVLWLFAYFAYAWSVSGKTLGMALLGIRVVAKDGTHAGWRRAVVRTLALPLSFLLFGLGLVGIVLQKHNRALHDFIAGTAVVYSWDARAARIRFLARTTEPAGGRAPGR